MAVRERWTSHYRCPRCGAASDVGLVDDIVVIQRPDMDQLHRDPGLYRAMVPARPELGGEQGQEWSEALAAGQEEVLCDLGQIGVVGGGGLEQPLLDTCQRIPDNGNTNETLEVFHS